MRRHFRVAIAGTGFAGLGMAIRLAQAGLDEFVLLERADDVGGVWRDNSYPGAACDVQSHLYSLSFAPNPHWTRAYSAQAEIQSYLRGLVDRFGLRSRCRFGHTVEDARWDDGAQRWVIRTSRGEFTSEVFISAMGGLAEPSIPSVPGLSSFGGKVMHSARWDHSYDLRGKRVAVIGTGASAIQFIPQLQPVVATLHVFQRTPPWVLPRRDRPLSPALRRVFSSMPPVHRMMRGALYLSREVTVLGFLHPWLLEKAQRIALKHLHSEVRDPALRAKLTPKYTLGCKRILLSDDYLPSLTQPNVEVISGALQAVRQNTLIASDGAEREVDAIILGTGFHVTDMPLAQQVRGRSGSTLEEVWQGSPKAFLGTTVAGFPNFFQLSGPNTGLGHSSVLEMVEAQIEHTLQAIQYLEGRGLAAVEPTAHAQAAFVREVDARMAGTVWLKGGCSSWYLDRTGRNSTLWPGSIGSFRRRTASFDPTDYVSIPKQPRRGRAHA